MSEHPKQILRQMVRGAYDLQQERVSMGNRICTNFKAKLGQKAGVKEEDMEKENQRVLQAVRQSYKRITDGIAERLAEKARKKANGDEAPETFKKLPTQRQFEEFGGDGVISSYTELVLVRAYTAIVEVEEEHFRLLRFFLKQHPIWNEYLVSVKGVGHAMAAVIISEIDIEKATYGSTIWRYAGLDVGPDGRGRSRRKDHLVEYAYKDKDGETQTRKGITFNPFLKTKLIGVLGSSFLRAKGPYSDVYYDYKHRLENSPAHAEKTKGHRHNMAVRYMVKRFLQDLYNAWRPLEGLPAHPEYAEAKLGIVHHKKPPKDDDDRPKV